LGFVHTETTTPEGFVVESIDRSESLAVIGHFDESETTGTARLAVRDNLCTGHLSVLREEL
jgi:hypothetical protein